MIRNPLYFVHTCGKTTRKGPKQLQFYDEVGNLIRFEGLAVLIISVYVKSRIIVQNRGVR